MRQMKKGEHEEFISNINRLAPHIVYHNTTSENVEDKKGCSKIQNSPTPPNCQRTMEKQSPFSSNTLLKNTRGMREKS